MGAEGTASRSIAALARFTLATPVAASTNTTDITRMSWNAAESGWGLNVTLQNDLAFLTFYLYSPGRAPVWYSAQATYRGAVGGGDLLWDGPLFESQGPHFGGAFNPSAVSTVQAGTVSFRLTSIAQATLIYSVHGTTVARNIERFTFRQENYTGNYAGGYSLRAFGCVPSSLDRIDEEVGFISVTHNGSAFLD